ncbi:HAD hydrolase-like protein [Brevibacillus centrosporus]|nr:HAD hydrolase-like protein [Brevibacillus centrosporus]MEC2129377.1 HAD hydrolase-like protein [Brevibacillus centrosporus]GED34159.1 hypothetical protein BCE02nite_53000 [Brevibacillus centrosporus]
MRTILFDFDGTVADTLPLIFTAFRSTFQRFLHKHYTDEQIIALFGPTETGIVKRNCLPTSTTPAWNTFLLPIQMNICVCTILLKSRTCWISFAMPAFSLEL